jgi:hypothetical protein
VASGRRALYPAFSIHLFGGGCWMSSAETMVGILRARWAAPISIWCESAYFRNISQSGAVFAINRAVMCIICFHVTDPAAV